MSLTVGILTVSDTCSRGRAEDGSGKALAKLVQEAGWKVEVRAVVPDEAREIRAIMKEWADDLRLSLILTTGGTGAGPRDVTPEATEKLLERALPGLPELIRREGVKSNPRAALSRGLAGIRGKTLIINLPGSPRGAAESFQAVAGLIPHALEVMDGARHDPAAEGHRIGKEHAHG